MTNFLSKSRNVTLAIKNWSELGDLYAYAQPIFLLCCKFQIIILKTVGEVAEMRALLCHMYKVIFLNKSRICNSSNENSIRVLSGLCTCPAYLTTVQVSNYYLENSRSCGDRNRTMACVYEFFLRKSWVCHSTNNSSIRVLWPLCTCSVYILTMVLVSTHILKTIGEVVETYTIL